MNKNLSKSLNDIISEVVRESGSIALEEALEGYDVKDAKEYMFKTPYFRCLAAYCKLYEVKHVLEIGTCTGASAVAMAHHATKVSTFDVTSEDVDESLTNKNIDFYPLQKPTDCLDIDLAPYDLIFIDIDHKGDMELQLHNKLLEEYKGVAFYDDIYFSPDMQAFWDAIKNPKSSLPWHFTGFGIVEY
jgi:predicted O-methyltransferase YrrM